MFQSDIFTLLLVILLILNDGGCNSSCTGKGGINQLILLFLLLAGRKDFDSSDNGGDGVSPFTF